MKPDVRDGMRIYWDLPITMDDGAVLRADVYCPEAEGRYPAIMSYSAYTKGAAFQEKYKHFWDPLVALHPEITQGTNSKYACYETVDPEIWVPDGFACVRVDARGSGRSQGFMDPWTLRESQDFYHCIEWAAAERWCNGKVGLSGISYLAMNQWWVAGLQPPHLAAICPWEGAADYYREVAYHGGILSDFVFPWYPRSVVSTQYGRGERAKWRNRHTGQLVAGDETLSEEELASRRADMGQWILDRPLDSAEYRERSAAWDRITVPLLSAGNWGGQGLHPRGNVDGFVRSASKQKWLEMHGSAHWGEYYTPYGVGLQKRFFAYFLKGEDNGWDKQPPVQLKIRHVDRFVVRHENEWPLARTEWTRFHLDLNTRRIGLESEQSGAASALSFEALGQGVLLLSNPFERETEITGHVAAKLFVSSSTTDADIFVGLHLFDPDGREVTFQGSNHPQTAIGHGWLRASHRKTDPKLSTFSRPYHSHDERWPLKPGEPVELDVEIWPTCIVVPPGYRLGMSVRGKDWSPDEPPVAVGGRTYALRCGVDPFLHKHPADRPADVFGGTTTLHASATQRPYLLLPVIPPKD